MLNTDGEGTYILLLKMLKEMKYSERSPQFLFDSQILYYRSTNTGDLKKTINILSLITAFQISANVKIHVGRDFFWSI